MKEETKKKIMREMGARGGQIGGKRRAETLTPEQRQEISRKANEAKKRYAAERKAAAKKAAKAEGKK
jgi:hypothetical protein